MQWLNLLGALSMGLAAALAAGALVRRDLPRREPGWRYIGPGAMVWTALYGCSGFAGVLLYARLFVGSALPNPDQQMLMLSGLIVAIAASALFAGFVAHGILKPQFRWQPNRLEYTTRAGRRVTRDFSEVVSIARRGFEADYVLLFSDGSSTNVLEIASWVDELCVAIIASQPITEEEEAEFEE